MAQFNVVRADLMAKSARVENFEALVHLTPYEVHGERWSLGSIDKRIARRTEEAKLVPERAMRLDLRSLTKWNYSPAGRDAAASEVEHLVFIRSEIVRQIKERRESLVNDRAQAQEMVNLLDEAYDREQQTLRRQDKDLPEPKYETHQMRSLESSAEILRDANLLREVHEWEKHVSRSEAESNWEGRAIAREIMSGIAVEETKERLQRFLESKRVASLNLGDQRTGTLREVEARTLTDYLARAIESDGQRDHRQSINLAAHEHHGRLVNDFEKAKDYYATARQLASEAHGSGPQFSDKEKINLEIYAERTNDDAARERFFALARNEIGSRGGESRVR